MIKGFIFDLDGVVVDTAHYHFLAWRRLANHVGFDFGEDRNEQLKGVGRMESLELILDWGGIAKSKAEKQDLAALKNGWYQEYIAQMDDSEILEGVMPFLNAAKSQSISIAVGSGSKNAGRILAQIGIANQFATIVDGNRLTRSKPDPQVFQLAAADLGLEPEECVVFEDAAKGIDAALAGQFWSVGIGDEANLGHAHLVLPNFIAKTPDDVIKSMT